MNGKIIALATLGIAAIAPPAFAQTWTGQTLLMTERSPSGCSTAIWRLTFTVEGNVLKVVSNLFDLKLSIAADGTVKQDFRLANGARGSLKGRVATREFEYTSYSTGCQYSWNEVK